MKVELTQEWCMNMAKIEARAVELHEGCRMPMEQARELAASEARPDWYARGQDWGLADALTSGQSGDWVLDDIARAFAAGAAVAYAHGAAVVDKCNGYIVDNARLSEEVERLAKQRDDYRHGMTVQMEAVAELVELLRRLAEAVEALGVNHFGDDWRSDEVQELQAATRAARLALGPNVLAQAGPEGAQRP